MKTDRELLELAAKSFGYQLEWIEDGWGVDRPRLVLNEIDSKNSVEPRWNPLTDDGDALRLAVKLRLTIEVTFRCTNVYAWRGQKEFRVKEKHLSDDWSEWSRRAIVSAAAEIGAAMQ